MRVHETRHFYVNVSKYASLFSIILSSVAVERSWAGFRCHACRCNRLWIMAAPLCLIKSIKMKSFLKKYRTARIMSSRSIRCVAANSWRRLFQSSSFVISLNQFLKGSFVYEGLTMFEFVDCIGYKPCCGFCLRCWKYSAS